MIKVIDKLYLTKGADNKVGCCIFNRKYYKVHLRQGDLDGACGVYALMMYLLILNVVSRRQLEDLYGVVNKKDNIQHIFNALFNNKGLIREGLYYKTQLQPIINRYIGDLVTANAEEGLSVEDYLKQVKEYIDNENPIMVSVNYSGGGHALVAVGYEADSDGIFNIFCLDPAFDCPPVSFWNSVIEINQGDSRKYPHRWIGNEVGYSENVSLGEILTIDKKTNIN